MDDSYKHHIKRCQVKVNKVGFHLFKKTLETKIISGIRGKDNGGQCVLTGRNIERKFYLKKELQDIWLELL